VLDEKQQKKQMKYTANLSIEFRVTVLQLIHVYYFHKKNYGPKYVDNLVI